MKALTILLSFIALMLVVIPIIVSSMPNSQVCSSKDSCAKIQWRLQTASLLLLFIIIVTLIPAMYYIYQERQSTEGGENPRIKKLLMVGLGSVVIQFGIIAPWLASITENISRYQYYPPKDECPYYWFKGGDGSCKPLKKFEGSYSISEIPPTAEGITTAKKNTIFWDGYYNGGFLT